MPDGLTPDLQTYGIGEFISAPDTGRSPKTGFSGRGILRPFRRGQNGDFEVGEGERLVRAAVGLVLGTVCASRETLGELPWRTEFGSLLALIRLQNNSTALQQLAREYIVDALRKWVPAARITDVFMSTPQPDQLVLAIRYDVVDPASSRVIVPGIQTAVQLG